LRRRIKKKKMRMNPQRKNPKKRKRKRVSPLSRKTLRRPSPTAE
jgi:hypothetical protein